MDPTIPTRSRRRTVVFWSAGVTALAAVAAVVVWVSLPGGGPDDVVRRFLTAVRERDVDAALRIAGAGRPAGVEGSFVTPEALAGDWTIADVHTSSHEGARKATVAVRLRGPSGVPLARSWDAGQEAEFRLTGDHGWRIDNPFADVTFPAAALFYVDLNGKRVPVPGPSLETSKEPPRRFLLLPGLYTLNRTSPDLVDVAPTTILAMPVRYPGMAPAPYVGPTAKLSQAAGQALKSRLDECAAKTQAAPDGCPFGGAAVDARVDGQHLILNHLTDVHWQIVRYPAANLGGGGYANLFTLHEGIPGRVRLSATGDDAPNGRKAFTVECPIGPSYLAGGLTTTGSLTMFRWATPGPSEPIYNCR